MGSKRVRFPLSAEFEAIAEEYRLAIAMGDEDACEAARAKMATFAGPFISVHQPKRGYTSKYDRQKTGRTISRFRLAIFKQRAEDIQEGNR